MSQLYKKFKTDILAVAFFFVSLFLGLALVSFNPTDPSFNSTGQGIKASNYCGIFGSFLADIFYQGFGLISWMFVLGGIRIAILNFKGEEVTIKNMKVVWGALLVIVLSSLTSLYFPQTKIYSEQIFLGGLMGLGVSKSLSGAFNFVGVQVILWAATALLLVFYSEKNLQELAALPQGAFLMIKEKFSKMEFSSMQKIAAVSKEIKKEKNKKEEFPVINIENKSKVKFEEEKSESDLDEELEDINELKLVTDEEDEEQEEDEQSNTDSSKLATVLDIPKRKVIIKAKVPKKVANWEMPKINLLDDPPATRIKIDEKEIRRKAEVLTEKLAQFSIGGQVTAVKPGPAVTMFEFKPNANVKISKISDLADDLSLALSAESIRIIAPIPGRDVVGIETSNSQRETVYLKDLLAEDQFWNEEIKLPIALGKQANGEPKIVDLRKMPHLLVAGTTGSGKSVFTVSTIIGMLFRHSPQSLRLILVDPKQVDLAEFSKIPHLIMPPVTDPKKAVSALKWAVREMEKRNKSMSRFGARKLEEFNEIVSKLTPDQIQEHEKINLEYENQGIMKLEQYYYTPQPYLLIIVEEFADLMAVDKINVEQGVIRLAQMARACGIHLMLAMQSPRKEVVTGLIKTNIPGRISFKVASRLDSRVILDEMGAERLLANGDMLFLAPGVAKPARHHGPFLSNQEITRVAKFWADQAEPEFDPLAMRALDGFSGGGDSAEAGASFDGTSFGDEEYDERYDEILSWTSAQKEVSASLIQRKFRLGYPRAARIIEIFEKEGVVGPANGSKPRSVLVRSYKEAE